MFSRVYAGRRVLVTGHTGFKGSWLTQWLLDLGADVTGFALDPPTRPSLFEAAAIGREAAALPAGSGCFMDVRGDVRDGSALARVLGEAAPEIVFHLAAQPLVRRSFAEPLETYQTNVMGTVNLLEQVRLLAAAGQGPRVIVNVTSDKCYENRESDHPYEEGDCLGGFDPYSSSKGCAELVTHAYRRSFFGVAPAPMLATARAGNVVGGGDWGEDRLLPDCVRALSAGVALEVRDPSAVRPWQHVLESLSGYLLLGAVLWRQAGGDQEVQRTADGAWNFGPRMGANLTVGEVVDTFLGTWGGGEWRASPQEDRPHEARLLLLDTRKAEHELAWQATWSASDAVAAAARWYAAWMEGAEPDALRALCRADIAAYCSAAAQTGAWWASSEASA